MRIAFLRGINVGGHNVKNDVLREVFLGLDLTDVAPFIASGNIRFEGGPTGGGDIDADAELEDRLATALEKRLGWPVPTFVRSPAELAAIVEIAAAADLAPADGETLQVGFWHAPLDDARVTQVHALSTPTDLLRVSGRELYWLTRGPVHKSKLTGTRLERVSGGPVTCRNVTTLRRLVDAVAG